MPAAYPKPSDLTAQLKDLGVTPPSTVRLASFVGAAATKFERLTGWIPFLASDTPSARSFDPPRNLGRILVLDGGLLSITSLTASGVTRIANTDFWLKPYGGTGQYIEFASPPGGLPHSIVIIGIWGYSVTVPDDVWQCILRMAAMDVINEFLVSATGGLNKWSEGGASEEYGEQPLLGVMSRWKDENNKVLNTYRRVTQGF